MKQHREFREGHRGRVRQQYLAEGCDAWEEYRLLELALFYAIPQKDVKCLAHDLIYRFQGLAGVLSASPEELCQVPGIGSHAAELFSCFSQVELLLSQKEEAAPRYRHATEVAQAIQEYYATHEEKGVLLLLFNNRFELLRCIALEANTVSSPLMSARLLVEEAFAVNASMLALGCFTTSPILLPSPEDIANTQKLLHDLDILGLTLLECILCNGSRSAYLLKQALGPRLEQRKERLHYEE